MPANLTAQYLKAEEEYRRASPFWRDTADPPPFLIIHGTQDTGEQRGQVPIGLSERFAEKLRAAGGDVTFIALQDAPHGFTANPCSPHTRKAWQIAVSFLEKHLLNS